MKNSILAFLALSVSALLLACEREVAPSTFEMIVDFDFESDNIGMGDWEVFITEYAIEQEQLMEFEYGRKRLPSPLPGHGLMLSAHNRSDDMFIYARRMLQGLPPNAEFELTFELDIASAYPENSVGIGGSPGGSVFVKAGAVPRPPLKIPVGNYFEIDIDKGNQSTGGTDMIVLGTLGTQGELGQYQIIKRDNRNKPMTVRSNSDGAIWLVVGIDSGFEGKTTIYFDRIQAKFTFLRNISQSF